MLQKEFKNVLLICPNLKATKGKQIYKPGSVQKGDSLNRLPWVTIYLAPMLPLESSGLPERSSGPLPDSPNYLINDPLLFDLAPGGVYQAPTSQ